MSQSHVNTEPVFSARTRRMLSRYGGQYIEEFRWKPLDKPWMVSDGSTLLDEYEFHDQPKLGPMLVYERELDAALSVDELQRYFEGNTAPRSSLGNVVEDIRGVSPADELTFWNILQAPAGDTVGEHLETVRSRLEAADLPAAQRFMNRLSILLHELDRPSYSLYPQTEETGEDVSLTLRCWAVLRGPEFYAAVLATPDSLVWADEASGSDELMDVVTSRVSEHLGVTSAFVTTTEAWFTGSNVDQWGPARIVRPSTRMPTEEERIKSWYSDWSLELRTSIWGEEDAIWDDAASRWWTWVALRAISSNSSSTRESIAVMAKPSSMAFDEVSTTLKTFIEQSSSAEILPGLSEVYDSRIKRLALTVPSFFEIIRPAKVKPAAYIERSLFAP